MEATDWRVGCHEEPMVTFLFLAPTLAHPGDSRAHVVDPFCIEGAFFQIKMTPNQITMTAYEEDPFLIIFLRFDLNSLIGIKSGNLG
jgi:hypothetical protein